MDRTKRTIVLALAAFALVVAAACSVRAALDSAASQQDGGQGASQPQQAEAAEQAEAADSALNERQRALRAAYGSAERSVEDVLRGSAWTAADGSTLDFGEYELAQASGSASRSDGWAISSVTLPTASDGAGGATTMALDVGDSTLVATLAGSESVGWTLRCKGLAYASEFASSARAATCEVVAEGDGAEEVRAAVGDWDALCEAVSEWARTHAPTATKATWGGAATIDWRDGEVTTTFTLDDGKATTVAATWDSRAGSASVAKSR